MINNKDATLDNLEELKEHADLLFERHTSRLCLCECGTCMNRSPHPMYNCFKECQAGDHFDEKEKLEYELYKECICKCKYCQSSAFVKSGESQSGRLYEQMFAV